MSSCPEPIVEIFASERETTSSAGYHVDNSVRKSQPGYLVILRTRSGHGYFEDDRGRHNLAAGCAILYRHGEPSSYGYAREHGGLPWEFDYISFRGACCDALFDSIRQRFGSVLQMPGGAENTRLFEEVFQLHRERGFRDRFHRSSAVVQLLYALLRPLPELATEDPVVQAREYILNHFDSPMRIKEAADHVGLSREHLTRCFRERYGEGPGEFCRRLRLDRARDLLQATGATISTVAHQCGYADPDSFARAYERQFNSSPARDRGGVQRLALARR